MLNEEINDILHGAEGEGRRYEREICVKNINALKRLLSTFPLQSLDAIEMKP